MGCDIHPIVERHIVSRSSDGEIYWQEWRNAGTPDLGRNYELFAALADVRNHDGIEPVSEPRGLPGVIGVHADGSFDGNCSDMPCQEYQSYFREWCHDAHSMSWLSLAEIKAYNTDQIVDDGALVVGCDDDGRVLMTARATTAPGPHQRVGLRRIFTWPGDDEGAPTPWDHLIAEMERAKREGDTDDDIRLVFFFDN